MNSGVLADGSVTDHQSTFSQEFISSMGGVDISDPVSIGDIPIVQRGGVPMFRLLYDQQETMRNESVTHHSLKLYGTPSSSETLTSIVTAQLIWENHDPIEVNPVGGYVTDSPLGNGADYALLVPVSLFSGLSTNDYMFMVQDQRNGHNGPDEWAITDGVTLPDGHIIGQIPEPSSAALMLIALAAFTLRRKR